MDGEADGSLCELAEATAPRHVTILFSDLVGFSSLTEQLGDRAAAEVVNQALNVQREIIEHDQAGQVLRFGGDSVLAIFDSPSVAMSRALAIQQHFHRAGPGDGAVLALAVRNRSARGRGAPARGQACGNRGATRESGPSRDGGRRGWADLRQQAGRRCRTGFHKRRVSDRPRGYRPRRVLSQRRGPNPDHRVDRPPDSAAAPP